MIVPERNQYDLLDRITKGSDQKAAPGSSPAGRRFVPRLRQFSRLLSLRLGSSLVRRIVLLNMAGLLALLIGFLWLNQTRLGVIDARVQSLQVQGEIIAAALAGTAVVDGRAITIDPERLLDMQTGEITADDLTGLEFSLNPERIAPVLRRLVTPANLRARVYDRDGTLLLDTRSFYHRGDIQRLDLPPPAEEATLFERTWSSWKRRFGRTGLSLNEDAGVSRLNQEVQRALDGMSYSVVRVNAAGDTIVSYAAPIQRLRIIRGALQLSTQDGDIDEVIAVERLNILLLFAVVFAVMAIVSLLLANTIAKPVERLAIAAERVRRSIKSRQQIPDFSDRSDEIGHLSVALRGMTDALYNRIAAIESFAADVAHELKNPLTSLRSAVETLPMVKNDEARARLLSVIQHDVRRLDRLISDISDASRLDAELAKADAEPVDMAALLDAVVSMSNDMTKNAAATVVLKVMSLPVARPGSPSGRFGNGTAMERKSASAFFVIGHDSRLGQVFTNLLDNARSFSPPGSTITVRLSREQDKVITTIEDEGPGIPDHALERIFERFYTDRPSEQGFGQNSGLGLSISRQIIEVHRGTIVAANRPGRGTDLIGGAVFTVTLPAADATA
jgi:two-component system, OmpR family, sensor histidine kinase ChvG